MKTKTAKALPWILCVVCLALVVFLVGCFSATPDADSNISTPQTTAPETTAPKTTVPEPISSEYILSLNTRKFHDKSCRWVNNINPENKGTFTGNRDELIAQGYDPYGTCRP